MARTPAAATKKPPAATQQRTISSFFAPNPNKPAPQNIKDKDTSISCGTTTSTDFAQAGRPPKSTSLEAFRLARQHSAVTPKRTHENNHIDNVDLTNSDDENPETNADAPPPEPLSPSASSQPPLLPSAKTTAARAALTAIASRPSNSSIANTTPRKRPRTAESLTPLEQQYLEIKAANPDCIFFVEVAYKFRFFDKDALVASQVLGIVAFMDRSMYSASIPVHRLEVHVKKLVRLGYKVGVVRQIETAALKAAGSNRNAPFERKLTNIYTRGTMLFDMETHDEDTGESSASSGTESLVAVCEYRVSADSGDCRIAVIAVQLATATAIYDDFADNFLRTELEMRLSHIDPGELLVPISDQSQPTQRILSLFASKSSRFGESMRVERRPGFDLSPEEAHRRLRDTCAGGASLAWIEQMPLGVLPCVLVLKEYLDEFSLGSLFHLKQPPQPFGQTGCMCLSANTLASLEVFRNQSDGSANGSLFEAINTTKTKFGRRMLRRWVAQPLLDTDQLERRVAAVQELRDLLANQNVTARLVFGVVHQTPDLEKSLSRIFFGRASPKEVWNFLTSVDKIASMLPTSIDASIKAPLLRELFESLGQSRAQIRSLLEQVSPEGAEKNDKMSFLANTENYPDVVMHAQAERDVDAELRGLLDDYRQLLRIQTIEYHSVAGVDYLIELPNAKASKVPASWVKLSSTKTVSRFHPPEVVKLIQKRNIVLEELSAACERSFKSFLAEISDHFDELRAIIHSFAAIDCLFSLAQLATDPQYSRPEFVSTPTIEAVDSFNPILRRLCDNYVSNDVSLNAQQRCLVITGPNMGGKSSYVRQIALMALMAQIGSFVPASHARISLFDAIYVRMGASDDLARNQSTFMKELQQTSTILSKCTPKSLIILDELGRGTSTFDGTAIAHATLRYLVEQSKCITLFVTHYPSIGFVKDEVNESGAIRNAHMSFMRVGRIGSEAPAVSSTSLSLSQNEGNNGSNSTHDPINNVDDDATSPDDEIVFLHKLVDGLSMRSYGLNVARLAHIPLHIIATAASKSRDMERDTQNRLERARLRRQIGVFAELIRFGNDSDVCRDEQCVRDVLERAAALT